MNLNLKEIEFDLSRKTKRILKLQKEQARVWNFFSWYSGQDQGKLQAAYDRYKKEIKAETTGCSQCGKHLAPALMVKGEINVCRECFYNP